MFQLDRNRLLLHGTRHGQHVYARLVLCSLPVPRGVLMYVTCAAREIKVGNWPCLLAVLGPARRRCTPLDFQDYDRLLDLNGGWAACCCMLPERRR